MVFFIRYNPFFKLVVDLFNTAVDHIGAGFSFILFRTFIYALQAKFSIVIKEYAKVSIF